jgi:putative transposase
MGNKFVDKPASANGPKATELKYKTVKHIHEIGDLHELTFSCYQQRPLLTNEAWLKLLCQRLDRANELANVSLYAFVLMPTHVHLLLGGFTCEEELPPFLFSLKQPFSMTIKRQLKQTQSSLLTELTIQERPGKNVFRFWQEGPGCDRNLNTPRAITNAIDYFHKNPVEDKLCIRATDWKWSSARFYLWPESPLDPDLPKLCRLPRDYLV